MTDNNTYDEKINTFSNPASDTYDDESKLPFSNYDGDINTTSGGGPEVEVQPVLTNPSQNRSEKQNENNISLDHTSDDLDSNKLKEDPGIDTSKSGLAGDGETTSKEDPEAAALPVLTSPPQTISENQNNQSFVLDEKPSDLGASKLKDDCKVCTVQDISKPLLGRDGKTTSTEYPEVPSLSFPISDKQNKQKIVLDNKSDTLDLNALKEDAKVVSVAERNPCVEVSKPDSVGFSSSGKDAGAGENYNACNSGLSEKLWSENMSLTSPSIFLATQPEQVPNSCDHSEEEKQNLATMTQVAPTTIQPEKKRRMRRHLSYLNPIDEALYQERIKQLKEYKAKFGHPNVPETYKEDKMLGKWVGQVRALNRKDKLKKERYEELTQLGFDFAPGEKKINLETRIQQLLKYKGEYGNLRVPRKWKPNPGLGEWMHSQKKMFRRYQRGQKGAMNTTRRNLLLGIGVDFSVMDPGPRGDLKNLPKVAEIKDSSPNSHENQRKIAPLVSPASKSEITSTASSTPIKIKHQLFDASAGTMSRFRYNKWDAKFNELRQFKGVNGHTNVPRRSMKNPSLNGLGEWVHFQRRQFRNLRDGKKSTMTIIRKKALDQLGFEWTRAPGRRSCSVLQNDFAPKTTSSPSLQAKSWNDRYIELLQFAKKTGHSNVPFKYEDNPSLGEWVFEQRALHQAPNDKNKTRPTSLDEIKNIQYQKLCGIGFNFESKESDCVNYHEEDSIQMPKNHSGENLKITWEERFLELKQFKIRKGSCNVPEKWKVNPSLASWVKEQRVEYRLFREKKKSHLDDRKVMDLLSLGFQFEPSNEEGMLLCHLKPCSKVINKASALSDTTENSKFPLKKRSSSLTPRKSRLNEAKWMQTYDKLLTYKNAHGHCNVPRKWKDDPSLGEWVHFQRRQYRQRRLMKPNHMTDQRLQYLERIGFQFVRSTRRSGQTSGGDNETKTNMEIKNTTFSKKEVTDNGKNKTCNKPHKSELEYLAVHLTSNGSQNIVEQASV